MTHNPPIARLNPDSTGNTPRYDVTARTTTPDRVSKHVSQVSRRGSWWAAIVTGAVLASGLVSTTPALAIGPCSAPMPPPWCSDDTASPLNEVVVLATGQKE